MGHQHDGIADEVHRAAGRGDGAVGVTLKGEPVCREECDRLQPTAAAAKTRRASARPYTPRIRMARQLWFFDDDGRPIG